VISSRFGAREFFSPPQTTLSYSSAFFPFIALSSNEQDEEKPMEKKSIRVFCR
jgi:hypothetical protein